MMVRVCPEKDIECRHGLDCPHPCGAGAKDEAQERIVAAAVYHGATISLPPPARHHTILAAMDIILGARSLDPANQGFLTSAGRFVNRVEGYYIAERAGQIKHKSGNPGTPELYSEDMW